MGLVAVYDANVLYPSVLRDFLIRAGIERLVRPHWSDRILNEVFSNLAENRPDLDPARLERTCALMNQALRGALVDGYQKREAQLTLPDPKDRHVLALALETKANLIVTSNLRDFPDSELAKWDVTAIHPDDFLTELATNDEPALLRIASDIAATWRSPEATTQTVLRTLRREAPNAASLLLAATSLARG
jgi:predicted nucleic acid-binding protein